MKSTKGFRQSTDKTLFLKLDKREVYTGRENRSMDMVEQDGWNCGCLRGKSAKEDQDLKGRLQIQFGLFELETDV